MRTRALVLVAVSSMLYGCGGGALVSVDGLPLKRVVVYRNGVGYYERAGHLKADEVRFRMRGNEVGDFLATLAVMERGGSSVRAASFPVAPAADETPEPVAAPGGAPGVVPPAPPPAKPDPDALRTVVLALDGKEHDLEVGYVAPTPVWRPTYRLVVGDDGADLQAWGVVHNASGEDWKDVSLSLVAGAPLAFEASLGTPTIPDRPSVTDLGEVIAAVPRSETSLAQGQPPPPPPAPVAAPAAAEADATTMDKLAEEAAAKDEAPGKARAKKATRAGAVGGAGRAYASAPAPRAVAAMHAPMPVPAREAGPSAPRNLSALAAVAVEAGATRYDLPTAVTVPDKSATMVMLLAKRVPGETIFLFAPDGGVPDSSAHPFRVARFVNKSGGLLERGPIAIFEHGAFLGQGMVDPLPDGATTTVPFALERSLAVDTERTFGEEGARLFKIEAGTITVERDAITRTKYRVRNGGDKVAKVRVKHGRAGGTRLEAPPTGTEDNVGTGSALVPVDVAPSQTAELVVDERLGVQRGVDWLSALADDAVKGYLADARADAAVARDLRAAWDVRGTLVKAVEERNKLEAEKRELENASEETRRNLKAIEKNKGAADLRAKLTERLAKHAARLDEITKRNVELDMAVSEQRVRFTDLVRGIKMLTPLAPAPRG